MLKDLLEGKPIVHPLHTLLVHFPIGLFVLSFLLDLGALLLRPSDALVRAAWYAMAFGVVMALLAAVPGFADWSDIRRDNPARRTAYLHMVLNLTAVGLYVLNLLLRYGARSAPTPPLLPFALSLVGVGLLGVSGYLGGDLVYNDGIGVGRRRRRTPTPRETIRATSTSGEGDWVTVADADRLGEGETLRAEVDGQVMTAARVNGRVCAFQEFCTHRFGPLSEGTFEDSQVVCPWHDSHFDVTTGKVTRGPAKVGLRTFETAVQKGKIRVRAARESAAQG